MFVPYPKDDKFKQVWTINVRDRHADAVIFQHENSTNAMLVLKGSAMYVGLEPKSLDANTRKIRKGLRTDGIVDERGIFLQHVIFATPSTAAKVLQGNQRNGREYWKYGGISINDTPGPTRHCYYDAQKDLCEAARYIS